MVKVRKNITRGFRELLEQPPRIGIIREISEEAKGFSETNDLTEVLETVSPEVEAYLERRRREKELSRPRYGNSLMINTKLDRLVNRILFGTEEAIEKSY